MPSIASLNISPGGVPKRPVAEAEVTALGLRGDDHDDKRHHGGPDRALCLYSTELIAALRDEGHPIAPGTVGENVTIAGLDWERVTPGARLRIGGGVEVEVTSYTSPCRTIRESFADGRFGRISQKSNPGWSRVYVRVVHGVGRSIRVGDEVTLVTPEASLSAAD
jgi:MOSC domain-containing protein YiiM